MSDHHLLRQKELSSDNFELSVGVGISVAQRQAARPFMSHLLHYEKICYTMATIGLWIINCSQPRVMPSSSE